MKCSSNRKIEKNELLTLEIITPFLFLKPSTVQLDILSTIIEEIIVEILYRLSGFKQLS